MAVDEMETTVESFTASDGYTQLICTGLFMVKIYLHRSKREEIGKTLEKKLGTRDYDDVVYTLLIIFGLALKWASVWLSDTNRLLVNICLFGSFFIPDWAWVHPYMMRVYQLPVAAFQATKWLLQTVLSVTCLLLCWAVGFLLALMEWIYEKLMVADARYLVFGSIGAWIFGYTNFAFGIALACVYKVEQSHSAMLSKV